MVPLTQKQFKFFCQIAEYISRAGVAPTLREAQELGGFASTRSAAQYLDVFEERGYIQRETGARSLKLLVTPEEARLSRRAQKKDTPTARTRRASSSILLVNGTDLNDWARRRDAQSTLPHIVRRLVFATAERPSRVSFGSAEAVQLGGWDGITITDRKTSFVPEGVSGWELGTTTNIKAKADEDYKKRTADPGELAIHRATFLFVTARRWPSKHEWAAARQKEGRWRDVRAYDSDDLEAWLELAPVIHIWVSSLLGKAPAGASDLDSFWEDWVGATSPALSPSLVLAGRAEPEKQIADWVRSDAPSLAIQAETRAEAVAAFAAVLQRMPENERFDYAYRSVVVQTAGAWQHLAAAAEPTILIPIFDNRPVVTNAIRNGHRVLIPLGRADSATQKTVSLGPIQRKAAEELLLQLLAKPEPDAERREPNGRPNRRVERHARELASLARRSVTALRRSIALAPELEEPPWAKPGAGRVLLPALLAGKWDETKESDKTVVSQLAGMSYDAFEEHLVRWSHESDAPVRHVGAFWFIISKEDAWPLLYRFITRDDLRRFRDVAVDVLGAADPRFDLPPEKQWMARAIGHPPQHSDALRNGLSDSLALLGTDGDLTVATAGESAASMARGVVRNLLEKANADWRLWASVSHLLPLLAEAAPDEFLSAVETGVRGDAPVLREMFRDRDDASFMSSSPHTGLLWALERVAWAAEYLPRAADALARLSLLDPGGRLANRPGGSLRQLFLLWHPQTEASLKVRQRVLDTLRERVPIPAWRLMKGLLPQFHDMSMNHQPATWRTWGQEEAAVTHAEYARGVHEVTRRMLEDVGDDAARWRDLLDDVARLPKSDESALLDALADLDVAVLPSDTLAAIWHALREVISLHRGHRDAEWSMPSERIDRLAELYARFTPVKLDDRFGWLFKARPAVIDGREPDWNAHDQLVRNLRREAIGAVFAAGGIDAVMRFAAQVEHPNEVGLALSALVESAPLAEGLLTRYLASSVAVERAFARGFAWASVAKFGRDWTETILRTIAQTWRPEQRAELLDCLPYDTRTFDLVDGSDKETQAAYWRRMYAFGIPEDRTEYGARRLLQHGRPYAAVDFVAARFHLNKTILPTPSLIVDVLEAVVPATPTDIDRPDQTLAYDIGELLDKLVESPRDVERRRIASLEWAFMPALRHHHHPRLLHEELARDPSFFVDLVSIVYRGKNEEPRELSDEEAMRARVAYDVLDTWHTLPGRRDDTVDPTELDTWIRETRERLAEANRREIGDFLIGQVLAASPPGDDAAWPHPAVRDVIEDLANSEIERGLSTRIYNERGVVTKSLDEGGEQERRLVEKYERWSAITNERWPRTAAMLRQIAASYGHEAVRSDTEVELRDNIED